MGIIHHFLLVAFVIFPTVFRGHRSVSITCQSKCPYIFNLGSSLEAFGYCASSLIYCFCMVSLKRGMCALCWQDQLGRMAILSGFLFVMLALGTDGVAPVMQSRRPLPLAEGLPKLSAAISGYKYVLLKLGPFQLTRKGVSLAASASCLSFTVSSHYLWTTFWNPVASS